MSEKKGGRGIVALLGRLGLHGDGGEMLRRGEGDASNRWLGICWLCALEWRYLTVLNR
ncbi:hypothetical protein KS4_26320 [Poriferisphaera corsica]|uniref:Uncharacterized protein n=1 Tax=Poriferisphaera corsica TaxID=2528020 RepID=A0A517YWH9_9BACT|nr:hypothetical protein KS4_26320 [Poriferisphaera corsica]